MNRRDGADSCWPDHFALHVVPAPARVAVKSDVATKARVEYIDVTRGLLVMWMVVGHALTLAQIPGSHPLQMLRPAGWATVCFVLLSGLSLAIVYGQSQLPSRVLCRKLWRRGAQILAIAMLSNLASMAITSSASGLLTPAYVGRVLTFQVPGSISGVLIPTGFLVLLGPALLWLAQRFGAGFLAGVLLLLNLLCDLAWLGIPSVHAFLWKTEWLFAFPIVRMCLCATAVFALAKMAQSVNRRSVPLPVAATALLLAAAVGAYPQLMPWFPSIVSIARVLVCVALGAALLRLSVLAWVTGQLTPVGRSALLLFILHRPLLRIFRALGEDRLPAEGLAVFLIVCVCASLVAVGTIRLHLPWLSAALRRAGL